MMTHQRLKPPFLTALGDNKQPAVNISLSNLNLNVMEVTSSTYGTT